MHIKKNNKKKLNKKLKTIIIKKINKNEHIYNIKK